MSKSEGMVKRKKELSKTTRGRNLAWNQTQKETHLFLGDIKQFDSK